MDRVISQSMGQQLTICATLGVAFQTDMRAGIQYDDAYFEKYRAYEGTESCDRINAARVSLVQRLPGQVLDIGIGAGTFLKKSAESGVPVLGGYDVNPCAILWLQTRGWFIDPAVAATLSRAIIWTFWDSLEHIREPHLLLDLVRPGDSVCLSIPVFCELKHITKSKHYKPGEHFYYFTPAGLIRWLDCYGLELLSANRDEESAGRESVASYVFRRVGRTPGKPPGCRCGFPETVNNLDNCGHEQNCPCFTD